MQGKYRQWIYIVVAFCLGLLVYGIYEQVRLPRVGIEETAVKSEGTIAAVAEQLSPSVVGIVAFAHEKKDFFSTKHIEKSGSGLIIHSDGLIVTNNHVVSGADRLVVTTVSGEQKEAKLVGRDARSDIAVLKIEGDNYRAARLGSSDNLVVGETVVAIGNPLGQQFARSVTAGVVSGLNRVINTEEGYLMKLIQTDAAINPGNSGGPLVTLKGDVVGINTVKISVPGFEGMGFAVPSKQVVNVVDQITRYGRVKRPALGLKMVREITAYDARYFGLPVASGVVVCPCNADWGRRLDINENDIICKMDGRPVRNMEELEERIASCQIGQRVVLEVLSLPRKPGQAVRVRKVLVRLVDEGDLVKE